MSKVVQELRKFRVAYSSREPRTEFALCYYVSSNTALNPVVKIRVLELIRKFVKDGMAYKNTPSELQIARGWDYMRNLYKHYKARIELIERCMAAEVNVVMKEIQWSYGASAYFDRSGNYFDKLVAIQNQLLEGLIEDKRVDSIVTCLILLHRAYLQGIKNVNQYTYCEDTEEELASYHLPVKIEELLCEIRSNVIGSEEYVQNVSDLVTERVAVSPLAFTRLFDYLLFYLLKIEGLKGV
jgi:hypothetical protein